MSPPFAETHIEQLEERGWTLFPQFLPSSICQNLFQEALELRPQFKKAGIGSERAVHLDIRGDFIHWLKPEEASAAQKEFWIRINELQSQLNRSFFLNLKETEAHFAIYPEGSFYKKHLDQFQGNTHRIVSFVFYLAPDWTEKDEGQLRIYSQANADKIEVEILPEQGKLVCFLSDRIQHEVLPTRKERVSLTGWMRDQISHF